MSIKYTVDDILKNENLDVSDNFKYKGKMYIKLADTIEQARNWRKVIKNLGK